MWRQRECAVGAGLETFCVRLGTGARASVFVLLIAQRSLGTGEAGTWRGSIGTRATRYRGAAKTKGSIDREAGEKGIASAIHLVGRETRPVDRCKHRASLHWSAKGHRKTRRPRRNVTGSVLISFSRSS